MSSPEYKKNQAIGKYRLHEKIGTGGNCVVWSAHEGSNCVAIKILKGKHNGKSENLSRFKDEVNLLYSLNNEEGILPILNSHLSDNSDHHNPVWLSMPIATPILQYLTDDSSIEDIVTIVLHYANILKKLHSKNIFHRDIKPANLYWYNEKSFIGDFGIAYFKGKLTHTSHRKILGPRFFHCPEILNEDPSGINQSKADVYSLAKTFWVLLTNQRYPIPGEIQMHQTGIRASDYFSHKRKILLDKLIELATKHKPSERISIDDFISELQAWLTPIPNSEDVFNMDSIIDEISILIEPQMRQNNSSLEKRNSFINIGNHITDQIKSLEEYFRKLNFNVGSSGTSNVSTIENFVNTHFPSEKGSLNYYTGLGSGFGKCGVQSGVHLNLSNENQVTIIAVHNFIPGDNGASYKTLWHNKYQFLLGGSAQENMTISIINDIKNNFPLVLKTIHIFFQK